MAPDVDPTGGPDQPGSGSGPAPVPDSTAEPRPRLDPADIDPTAVPCRHLRSTGMYLYTDGRAETDLASGYDNTIHWCLKTHKGFGPDDDLVTRLDCRDTSRPCYEPL